MMVVKKYTQGTKDNINSIANTFYYVRKMYVRASTVVWEYIYVIVGYDLLQALFEVGFIERTVYVYKNYTVDRGLLLRLYIFHSVFVTRYHPKLAALLYLTKIVRIAHFGICFA
ncbi:hypothetical protein SAMN05660830_01147 [Halodesulfovibrio aestuarii]|uniref:Uncharacterized protein n=1 Tax=Halodesulfovibrio aestuarii TaxID=126333 RepID=A0A8G2FHD6_9BACT|nr:hypothetical protein SAMN05660830_01147 [Halodesulfovibrio aestuarii]